MTVRVEGGGSIVLEGTCPIEDAEPLLHFLTTVPGPTVDWRSCDWAHTAIIQILLASRVPLQGPPRGALLRDVIEPLIIRAAHPI
jgi:hypothetical protein